MLVLRAVTTKLKAMGGAIKELSHRVYLGRRVWAWVGKDHKGDKLDPLRDRPFGGRGQW